MKMKKIVAAAAALSLTAAIAVGGTLAYLTQGTNEVKNTFTYDPDLQNITLNLYEGTYNPEGVTEEHPTWVGSVGDPAVDMATKNENYKIIPGATAPKNPTLFVTTQSASYIYAEVVSAKDGVVTPNVNAAWSPLMIDGEPAEGIHGGTMYYLTASATAGVTGEEEAYQILDSVTYKPDMALTDTTENVSVYGYAIAVTGMGDYVNAWNTAKVDFQA